MRIALGTVAWDLRTPVTHCIHWTYVDCIELGGYGQLPIPQARGRSVFIPDPLKTLGTGTQYIGRSL